MQKLMPECAKCTVKHEKRACLHEEGSGPSFCPTKNMKDTVIHSMKQYRKPEILKFARSASIQEAECYAGRDERPFVFHPTKTRMEEICEFAEKMNFRRLGLAYCDGLRSEAALFQKFLEGQGFEIASVVCKVGCTPKEEIGIADSEKIRIGQFESMCSPVSQAEILNEAGTELNIIMGLCVGHDSLFMKYAEAPTTVFAVKDRVLGHNPLAALYTMNSYYRRLGTQKQQHRT